ncbi:uncharacterized protein F5147DRAFT_837800 [Suillus discolor]|uniref:Glutathione S-transferase UstS-like C-terminal domain-containing protein n=1 Tax=Suillus discolor TaxID=1912936 RepID=A0A9P7JSK3_9AGAM|nr:uncharacterized protein F5147DRAFT_837800 [Suillus discolor]KAG2106570.1 hypothetical protein F5147DRAFT_837800 [Suillus discolor]
MTKTSGTGIKTGPVSWDIGASPTAGKRYTVPAIKNLNTGIVVYGSHAIAKYLDETDKLLIPRGAHVLVETSETPYINTVMMPSFKLLMTRTLETQNDISWQVFIQSRLKMFRETHWEDMAPEGKAQQMWAALKKGLGVVNGWYQKSGGRWIMGNTFSFTDIVVVSCKWIVWWNAILNKQERQEVHTLHGEKWARLLVDVNAGCNTDLGSCEEHSH